VEAVAERLKRYQVQNVVLDTVMLAKSGDPLLSASAVETLRKKLLPQVALITPIFRKPPRCWARRTRKLNGK
jgi:hydroxymethylpyrimidine/phosphomethylpyrimidine kinase